jgi:membrane protein DedA with SNARE-associated domain
MPLARTFVSLPAGARRLPLIPFIVLTTFGCAIWAVIFVAIGIVSGAAWSTVSSVLGKACWVRSLGWW